MTRATRAIQEVRSVSCLGRYNHDAWIGIPDLFGREGARQRLKPSFGRNRHASAGGQRTFQVPKLVRQLKQRDIDVIQERTPKNVTTLQNALRRRREANQEGFTLIELLIVIVILGILAAVVVFAISG